MRRDLFQYIKIIAPLISSRVKRDHMNNPISQITVDEDTVPGRRNVGSRMQFGGAF